MLLTALTHCPRRLMGQTPCNEATRNEIMHQSVQRHLVYSWPTHHLLPANLPLGHLALR